MLRQLFLNIFTLSLLALPQLVSADNKVDPDSFDPSVRYTTYVVAPSDFSITSYQGGSPSHFTVTACERCIDKRYELATDALLELHQQPIEKSQLSELILKKEYDVVDMHIDRQENKIIGLYLGGETVEIIEEN